MAGRLTRSESRESVFSTTSCVSGVGDWQLGDRVRMGDKIGSIAFVGHTKFAPGEWIGLILDDPVGKNNGVVQGVAYFACAENYGLFCKSSKLERISGPASLVSSPMQKSESESPYAAEFGIDIGDRVLVSGGKAGILRFLGPTDFAQGIWAGVELDQPLGKNDGSVQGKRYFTCKAPYGLFSPAGKTEKAPTSTPSKIRVRHNKTSMLRQKTGSHESLSSIGAASSCSRSGIGPIKRPTSHAAGPLEATIKSLQDSVKERDRHLEQMLEERDMERIEIAELTRKCEEYERVIADLDNNQRLVSLEQENSQMKYDLIEKEKQLDDLNFRLEEELINVSTLKGSLEEKEKAAAELKKESEETIKRIQENVRHLEEGEAKDREAALKAEQTKELEKAAKTVKELEEKLKGLQDELELNKKEKQDAANVAITAQTSAEAIAKSISEKDAQLAALHKELEDMKSALTDTTNQLVSEQKSLRAAMEREVSLEEKISEQKKGLEEAQRKTAETEKLLEALQEEVEKGRQEEATTKQTVNALQATLSDEKSTMAVALSQKETQLAALQNELDEKAKALMDMTSRVEELAKEIREVEGRRVLVEEKYVEETKRVEEARKEMADVEEHVRTLQGQVEEGTKTIETLQTTLADQKATAENILREKESQLAALELRYKTDVDQLSLREKELSGMLSEKESRIMELDGEVKKRTKEGEEEKFATQQILRERDEAKENVNKLSESVHEKENEIARLTAVYQALASSLEATQLNDNDKAKELAAAKEENATNKSRADQLEAALDKSEEKLKLCGESLAKEIEEKKNVETERKQLEEKKNELEGIIGKTREELEREKNEKQKGEQTVNELHDHIKKIEEERIRLSASVSEKESLLKEKEEALKAAQENAHKLTAEVEQLSSTSKTLLVDGESAKTEMAATIHIMEEEIRRMQKEREELEAKQAKEREEHVEELGRNALENAKLAELVEELRHIGDGLAVSHNQRIEQLQAELAEKEEKVHNLSFEVSAKEENIVALSATLELAVVRESEQSKALAVSSDENEKLVKKITALEEQLTKSESQRTEISEREKELAGKLIDAENTIKQTNEQLTAEKQRSEKLAMDLQNELQQKEMSLNALKEELANIEKEKSKLTNEIQLSVGDLQIRSEESLKATNKITQLTKENEELKKNLEKLREGATQLANERETFTKELENARNDLKTAKDKIISLQLNSVNGEMLSSEAKQKIALYEELEEGHRKKEAKMAERIEDLLLQLDQHKARTSSDEVKSLSQQVEFLHSIIAESEVKIGKYKEEIDILRNLPPDGSSSFAFTAKESKPRMYCDICEVFDQHETEDCPTQGMVNDEGVVSPSRTKIRPPPREYCDHCEEFGHDTANCPKKKKKKEYTF